MACSVSHQVRGRATRWRNRTKYSPKNHFRIIWQKSLHGIWRTARGVTRSLAAEGSSAELGGDYCCFVRFLPSARVSSSSKTTATSTSRMSNKKRRAKRFDMSEEQFRTAVLIPLFEAMGFHNVYHYHGGIGEKGKDIVMWKTGNMGQREEIMPLWQR
jgi:hypothetical protein